MLVQSLRQILEGAAAEPGSKRLSGNIRDFNELFTRENIESLESSHDGVFAFLAFHPRSDQAVADYVRKGSLAADAGEYVFVLFALDDSANVPRQVSDRSFEKWLTVDDGRLPAYELVRALFPANKAPALPGVLFIERFTGSTEPLFLSIGSSSTEDQVRALMRTAFSMAAASYLDAKESGTDFIEVLGGKLAAKRLSYRRAEGVSMREWLIKAFWVAKENLGDIVSVIKLFK